MELQDTNGMDQARWYEIRRNELLKLLDRTSKVEIPDNYATELASIRKKCLENQFEIVLVGEFQGGKSTTFNALCDGRDLSPRGLGGGGIKTSAAIISAQNISDDKTQNGMNEWAEITFKTKYDIQKGMFDILHEILAEDKTFRETVIKNTKISSEDFIIRMSVANDFAKVLDLDNPVHRTSVKNALNFWWSQWENNKSLLDEELKDRLHIATLQERFYGSTEYKKLLKSSSVGIYEFQSLIAFPSDWIIRWKDGKNAPFKLQEVAFIFIARTLLRIHSENLASLGCRITDCPGLFANAYDTSVAQQAISHSDAIWYLIGGAKTVGEKDLKSLDFIKQMGMLSKIIGSVNLMGKHSTKMEQVFPATKAMLKDHDFSFQLLQYNARLAFLASQGKRMAEGKSLSDYEIACMRIDSDNVDGLPAEMWIEMVNDSGVNTGLKELKHLDNVSKESVSLVRRESHFDDIMSSLTQEIISKKSRSILIDNGSQKAARALLEYEGKLKISEDAAIQDEATWKQNVEDCEIALRNFIEKSKEIIEDSTLMTEKRKLSEDLALDLVQQTINDSFIEEFAFLIAMAIDNHSFEFHMSEQGVTDVIVKDVMPKLNPLFTNSIMKVMVSWRSEKLASDSWYSYKRRIYKIGRDIKSLWNADIGTKNYLKDIHLEMPGDETINAQLIRMQNAVFDNDQFKGFMDSVRWSMIKDLFILIVAFIPALICIAIGPVFKKIIGKPLTPEEQKRKEIKAKRERENKLRKLAREQIIPKIGPSLKSLDFQANICQEFVEQFDSMQSSVIESINNSVDSLLSRFQEEHVDPAKRNLSESESKRKEIAERNHQIRVEQIEPLRIEIQNFESQVSKEIDA